MHCSHNPKIMIDLWYVRSLVVNIHDICDVLQGCPSCFPKTEGFGSGANQLIACRTGVIFCVFQGNRGKSEVSTR